MSDQYGNKKPRYVEIDDKIRETQTKYENELKEIRAQAEKAVKQVLFDLTGAAGANDKQRLAKREELRKDRDRQIQAIDEEERLKLKAIKADFTMARKAVTEKFEAGCLGEEAALVAANAPLRQSYEEQVKLIAGEAQQKGDDLVKRMDAELLPLLTEKKELDLKRARAQEKAKEEKALRDAVGEEPSA